MDDSSASSYQEEYWLLKKQYDDVLESNSQMVLRLEEAKLMLFKSTKQLQSQNSVLMSDNMNLRAQKEYLQQELVKFRFLINNLTEEMETQKGSMERQKGCLAELMCQVDSVTENKDNGLANMGTETAQNGKENAPFLNPTALRELDKQLRPSNMGSYYLPAIQEEKCGRDDNSDYDDGHEHRDGDSGEHNDGDDDDDSSKVTRPVSGSASRERIQEEQKLVQGNSKLAIEEEILTQEGKETGGMRLPPRIEGRQRMAGESATTIENISAVGNDREVIAITENQSGIGEKTFGKVNCMKNCASRASNNHMMASMESSTSMLVELSKHFGPEQNEKRGNCTEDRISRNEASETICSDYKDIDLEKLKTQNVSLRESNNDELAVLAQGMNWPLQTPNAIIVKNIATSYQDQRSGGPEHKISRLRHSENHPDQSTFTEFEFIQRERILQDQCIEGKIEKLVCHVGHLDVFGSAQPNSPYKGINVSRREETVAIPLLQNMIQFSTTRINDVALKLEDDQHQRKREKPKSRSSTSIVSIGRSNAHSMTKVAVTKTSPDCEETKENDPPRIQEAQSLSSIAAYFCEILQAGEPKEPNESSEKPSETPCPGNKNIKPRKTQNIQSDASAAESKTQEAILPLARKSTYAKKIGNSLRHSNMFSPIQNHSISAATNAVGAESDVSLKLAILDENDYETRSISRKSETFGQRKPCTSVCLSVEDCTVSTGGILRQSQMANIDSLTEEQSAAASKGEACYSDYTMPNARRRPKIGTRELVSLIAECAAFQGDVGPGMLLERGIATRARSKPTRNPKEANSLPRNPDTSEPNGGVESKKPASRPR